MVPVRALLKGLLEAVRAAGAPSEDDTDRDGFLSYKSETHSVAYGLGLGAGIAFKLLGVPWVLELIVLSLGGVTAKRRFGDERVWREILDEPQYFGPSIVTGFLLVMGPALYAGASVALVAVF